MALYSTASFQFYPSDFLSHHNVIEMSMAARGVYITLLCHQWKIGSIPSDSKRMARLCGCYSDEIAEVWQDLAPCFIPHPEEPERLINNRLEQERAAQFKRSQERSISGANGAKARWGSKKVASDESQNGSKQDGLAIGLASSLAKVLPMPKNGSSSSSSVLSSKEEGTSADADGVMPTSTKHPAIEKYRFIHKRYPSKTAKAHETESEMDRITFTVGGNEEDLELWARALTEWKDKAIEHNLNAVNKNKWNASGVDSALKNFLDLKAELEYTDNNNQASSEFTKDGLRKTTVAGMTFYTAPGGNK